MNRVAGQKLEEFGARMLTSQRELGDQMQKCFKRALSFPHCTLAKPGPERMLSGLTEEGHTGTKKKQHQAAAHCQPHGHLRLLSRGNI